LGDIDPKKNVVTQGKLMARRTIYNRIVMSRERREENQAFLAKIGEIVAASLDYEETLIAVAELAVPFLADFSVVDIIDERGEVERVKAVHADSNKAHVARALEMLVIDRDRPHLMASVFHDGQPLFLPTLPPGYIDSVNQSPAHKTALQALDPQSLIVVPLQARSRLVGAISFVLGPGRRRYDEIDLQLAIDVALRVALAVDNARLYARAQQAIQDRDDMLAVVAHDLRNPLASVRLAAQLITRHPDLAQAKDVHELSVQIVSTIDHANRLIQDLLEGVRIDAGLELDLKSVRARKLLEHTAREHLQLLNRAGLEADVVGDPEVCAIADQNRILQVLENLLGNAIKFTPEGGRIELSVDTGEDEVVFGVSDTGPGIEDAAIPHLFNRFFQVRKTRRGGAGLGLSICKGIIEAHEGRIWVESEVGQGTCVYFTIPARDTPGHSHSLPMGV